MPGETFGAHSCDQPVARLPHLFGDDPHATSGFSGRLPQTVGGTKNRRRAVRIPFS
jgi:hypothetical protein